jgi:hypothetical protein
MERLNAPQVVLLYQWNHRTQDNVNEVIWFCIVCRKRLSAYDHQAVMWDRWQGERDQAGRRTSDRCRWNEGLRNGLPNHTVIALVSTDCVTLSRGPPTNEWTHSQCLYVLGQQQQRERVPPHVLHFRYEILKMIQSCKVLLRHTLVHEYECDFPNSIRVQLYDRITQSTSTDHPKSWKCGCSKYWTRWSSDRENVKGLYVVALRHTNVQLTKLNRLDRKKPCIYWTIWLVLYNVITCKM